MAKVYVSFMIEPDDKETMEALAELDQTPGEESNVSMLYRDAIRRYIKWRERQGEE